MRLKGKFEKQQLHVGLSEAVPLAYRGPEEKYTLADRLAVSATHVSFKKETLEFELVMTSDELVETPDRLRCYRLVSAMPDVALPEVEEQLRDAYDHYLALAQAAAEPKALPEPQRVTATIVEHVKT